MKKFLVLAIVVICLRAVGQQILPADRNATEQTVNLYKHLSQLQKEGLMFGHQDDMPYGNGWWYEEGRSDVKDVCRDYPAVYGWELGHLELGQSYSLDSVYFSKIQEGIKMVYQRGGVNTISWHLNNPFTGGSAWDVSSKEAVSSILPGGRKHDLYVTYLDRLSNFLLSLKTDRGIFIPVIFRPFHEHTGSWFWWGKDLCSVQDYKTLWRFTVTYLRDKKDIHHLVYAYSTDRVNTLEEYIERYPGDDVIDVLAFDLYDRSTDYSVVLKNCASIVSNLAARKQKVAAVSEAGGPIATNHVWWTGILLKVLRPYNLSYVLVWRNPATKPQEAFAPYKGQPSSQDFIKFFNDPHTLFQKDIARINVYKND
jgi:mannan endo-1,4-beta-mannosidase